MCSYSFTVTPRKDKFLWLTVITVGALCTGSTWKGVLRSHPASALSPSARPRGAAGSSRITVLESTALGKSHLSYCRRIQVTFWILGTSQGPTSSPRLGEDRSEGTTLHSEGVGEQGEPGFQVTRARSPPEDPCQSPVSVAAWDGQNLGTCEFHRRMSSQTLA